MAGGVSFLKLLAVVGVELTALHGPAALVRSLACVAIAWMFVISLRHRRLGLAP